MYMHMIRYGSKLKGMIKESGYTLKQISEKIDVPASTIATWYRSEYPPLEGIVKMCNFFNIELSDFFADETKTKSTLPEYITQSDAAALKILNTAIDPKSRVEIKKMYIHAMKAVLVMYKDKLGHMPEFKKLFEDEEK